MKINKENAGWIFCCALLAVLLGFSIYLGLSGWYFQNQPNYAIDFKLGETRVVELSPNSSQSLSLALDGSFLPGEELPQIIGVKNNDDERAIFVRAKAYVSADIMQEVRVEPTINWNYNSLDGYYYLADPIAPQSKVGFCSHIFADENLRLQSNEKYIITILFECLDDGQNVENLWGNNTL